MDAWIIITVGAAFLQNLRSLLQRRLAGKLSVNGASFVRFAYALPFAWVYASLVMGDQVLHTLTTRFFVYCLIGGVAQMLATSALLASMVDSNFAVGTALSKTETLQAALLGFILFGESLTWLLVVGIAISFVGVVLLSGKSSIRDLLSGKRAIVLGLFAGTGFALSAVAYRAASLALTEGGAVERAATTLAVALGVQVVLMGLFLALREPGQLREVWRARRSGVWVGLVGAGASAGWFTAMTMVSAALVRAVAQVELLFTFVTAVWILREQITFKHILGAVLIIGGILLLI
jgi:drug/metabolite transporter (DMT)-like permease